MGSTAECRGQRKQSVNWKNKQQKLPNLNNTEKTNEQSLRDLWDSNKKPNIHVSVVLEGRRKRAEVKKYSKKYNG